MFLEKICGCRAGKKKKKKTLILSPNVENISSQAWEHFHRGIQTGKTALY